MRGGVVLEHSPKENSPTTTRSNQAFEPFMWHANAFENDLCHRHSPSFERRTIHQLP